MGEFKCWFEKKDNPKATDAEIAAWNDLVAPLNRETQDQINDQWNRENGAKSSWKK